MRPVFYDYPGALAAPCDTSMAFTVGRNLMVAASPKPESPQPYDVCLPAGGWYDYWSGQRVAGQPVENNSAVERITETPRLDRLPLFVRAGTILSRQPVTQSTAKTPRGPLSLDIYPGPDCRGELYWDDGETLGYRRGRFLRQPVRCEASEAGLRLSFAERAGSLKPWWREMAVTVHDWSGAAQVRANGRSVPAQPDGQERALRFTLPDPRRGTEVVISRR
jgi:alpha-glucosidase